MISIAAGNRALCEKIGRKARHLIETKYQSGLLIGKLAAFYEYLLR
jgi:hypothetical protein